MGKILIFLAAALFVMITLTIWVVSFERIQLNNENIISVENSVAGTKLAEAEARLKELYSISRDNVLFIADLVETDLNNGISEGNTASILQSFLTSHTNYFQARLIDKRGIEKIRLESVGDRILEIDKSHLVNKKNLYYFQEAISLASDEVYISYLDLNVEKGQVELPFRPTIRFFTPVFRGNEREGIIGLNLNAQSWLNSFRSQDIFLLNSKDQIFIGDEQTLYKVSTVDLEKKDTYGNPYYFSKKISLEGNHVWQLYTKRDVRLIQAKKDTYRRRIYRTASALSAGSLLFLVIVYTFYKKNAEIAGLNNTIEASLQERNTLLKEIHHRVKNNLQVITSLLSLQSSFVDEAATKGLLRYSQYRIKSMAMIHEMLYQSDNLSRINYGEYLQRLIATLIQSMKGSNSGFRLEMEADDIFLNVDTSIPLGLMINEMITNSLKYGFHNRREGILSISLRRLTYPHFLLKIGDDGQGFPDDITFRNTKSLGLKLIHKLVLQLKGNIEKDNSKPGTHYIVSFQEIDQKS